MSAKQTDWAQRVRALREKHGWTQDDLADLLGLATRGAVCNLEQGRRQPTGPVKRLIVALEKNPKIFSVFCCHQNTSSVN